MQLNFKAGFPFIIFATSLLLSACSSAPSRVSAINTSPAAIFTVRVEGQGAIVRLVTNALVCPSIQWDGQAGVPMSLRAPPAVNPTREGSGQQDSKEAKFEVLTCEAAWPAGVLRASVAGQEVPAPRTVVKRIVVIADTGCRMKASENAFQPCNDPQKWPFAQIAKSAAALKPDLVIHIGDIHYRESPCPQGNVGCANSPWGYGFDTWDADFFKPAKPLLAAAPWVFVRGNHESCFRAGQGWFRFVDAQPWSDARSCNDPARDGAADYSAPYAVSLTPDADIVVFDSSKTSGKPFAYADPAYGIYAAQMKQVEQITSKKPNSFFMSHHPLLAVAPVQDVREFKTGGNGGLQSVFNALYPQSLFPAGVSVAMHGHVHLFEAISFKSSHPSSLVMGNSGSANEGLVPETLAAGTVLFPGAEIEDYSARAEYGFAILDRVEAAGKTEWLLTEFSSLGQPVIKCSIAGKKTQCGKNFDAK
jgi:Calcineurin-like phosphoesterase